MPEEKRHTIRLSITWDDEPPSFTIAFLTRPEHGLQYFRDQLESACDEIKLISDEHITDLLGTA